MTQCGTPCHKVSSFYCYVGDPEYSICWNQHKIIIISDICEDPELRERISQLINEQESKRMHDQSKKIRRGKSNKRTQSIRRTSIREKTLTPKKEAMEEGRLRLHLENKYLQNDPVNVLPDVCHTSKSNDSNAITIYPSDIEKETSLSNV